MISTQAPSVVATATRTRQPSAWPALVLAVLSAAAYAIFFVWPYFANDLDRFPLAEVAGGMHDPKDLWPRNEPGPIGFAFTFGGLLTLALAPFGAVVAVGWAALNVALGRPSRDGLTIAVSALTASIGIVTLVWLASPMASALFTWWFD